MIFSFVERSWAGSILPPPRRCSRASRPVPLAYVFPRGVEGSTLIEEILLLALWLPLSLVGGCGLASAELGCETSEFVHFFPFKCALVFLKCCDEGEKGESGAEGLYMVVYQSPLRTALLNADPPDWIDSKSEID